MDRGWLWPRALLALALPLTFVGCSKQDIPAVTAPTVAPAALHAPQTITTPAAAAASSKPEAVAPPVRGEPKGRAIYLWHTTISPAWLDPQENPAQVTPYNYAYAIHDALVKHMPGKTFAPSLAESYEIAQDFKSASFKLRPNVKFHNGEPVTAEDVKFTYEKYRGANAKVLKDKTDRIETPDDRTIRFVFKEPFLDFLVLYGSPASGAGWIVPKKYYEEVGPNGFKQKPIGAGPYKLIRQTAGTELELEAFADYWRKTPNVKTLIIKGVPEGATRVALLQTGEADFINLIPGELLNVIKSDPKLALAPTKAGPIWLEFPGSEKPDNLFHDVRIRQAISLAIDRKAFNDAEMGGYALLEGNWIPEDWPGAITRPTPAFDVARAKQLMAEAGKADGFEVPEGITPLPPYFSFAERVAGYLRAINIRAKVNTMERAIFYEKLKPGPDRLKGLVIQLSGAPGDAAARVRENVLCQGIASGVCSPEIEDRMKKYDSSANQDERKRLIEEVQTYILDNHIIVPIARQAFINAKGPRIGNKVEEIIGAIPQYVYPGPFEDIQIKE
ncbi:MAG: ABC transporter substrate-binding protein [Chloroflexi bacterium]|nr:ABC transporter substrate-binding protein [Chloroflexota bacterium]